MRGKESTIKCKEIAKEKKTYIKLVKNNITEINCKKQLKKKQNAAKWEITERKTKKKIMLNKETRKLYNVKAKKCK